MLATDKRYGFTQSKVALAKALGLERDQFKLKVSGKGWLYPGEVRKLSRRIPQLLRGEIVLERRGKYWSPVACDPPRPPVPAVMLTSRLDFRGAGLQITPVTGPTGRLPTPQSIFATAEKWEPKRRN